MVIAETAYMIDRKLGARAEARFYDAILNDGELTVDNLDVSDWERIQELVATDADMRLGGTDASVVTLAERLDCTRIATLNHRHFRPLRPRHAAAFELLP